MSVKGIKKYWRREKSSLFNQNFQLYLALYATLWKSFEFETGNIFGPYIRQTQGKPERDGCSLFILFKGKITKEKLSDHLTKLYNILGGERLAFYLAIDGTNFAQGKQVS